MAIKGLTDRDAAFPEIGSIRKGAPKPKDGKRPGADLKHFRVDFDERETASAAKFAAVYGREPTELNVLFPFNELERNFDAWRETYTAGALVHRCDGERIWYEIDPRTGQRLVVNGEPFKGCDGKAGCKPVARLKVIIPELGRLAYLVVHTTSLHDILNLSKQLHALTSINGGRLAGIPLKLRRRPLEISTPSGENGKRARREKWLLSVEADPEWVAPKMAEMRRLSLPESDGPLALPAPRVIEHPPLPAVASGPYDDEDDDEAAETGNEATRAQAPAARPQAAASTRPERPFPPELVKHKIELGRDRHEAAGGKASDKQRGLVAGVLEACFAGNDDAERCRHSVLKYLTGYDSLARGVMPDADVLSLLDWLKPAKDSGGQWLAHDLADREAQLVLTQALRDAGQMDLFDLEQEPAEEAEML